jgi:tetratricopeptide (TPR) repeat protein
MSEATLAGAAAHFQAGRLAEAGRECEALLEREPGNPGALNLLGIVAGSSGKAERAVELFGQALARDGANPNYHANLAAALRRLQRDAEALASCDAALAVQADHAPALNIRGTALLALGREAEALAACERAIAARPAFAEAHASRAMVLDAMGRRREALASFERSLALDPGRAAVRSFKAMLELSLGDYAKGWEDYEARWQSEDFLDPRRPFAQPLWLGKEDLRGKTILLYAEQGFGDTLQFMRYAPLVAAKGARVILEVQPQLAEVAAGVAGVERVIARGAPLPPFDVRTPLLSLPLAFGTRVETVPAEVPYLIPPAATVAKWRARLGQTSALRIGIAWSGSADYKNDRLRSLALSQLLFLQEMGAELFSLQKDIRPEDAEVFARNGRIQHFGAGFADTAALASLMDLVISVDTAIGHLAGAAGAPLWMLLSQPTDWRWMSGRDDSPWYPTARLFRQPKRGDWDSVLGAVRRALKAELDAHAARGETARLVDEGEREIRAQRFPAAEKILAKAAAADPRSGRAQYLLAVALHEQGALDRAIACYRKAARLDPAQAGLQRDFGLAFSARGRHAEALACYQEALRQDPADERACTGIASAYQALGDAAQARRHFQRGLRMRLRRWLLAPFGLFRNRRGTRAD